MIPDKIFANGKFYAIIFKKLPQRNLTGEFSRGIA